MTKHPEDSLCRPSLLKAGALELHLRVSVPLWEFPARLWPCSPCSLCFLLPYLMMIYWALIYLSASVIKILKGTWPWHHHIAQLLPDFTQKRAAFDIPGLSVWGQWSAAGWIGEWLPSWLSSARPGDRQLWTQDFIPGTDLSSRRVFKALEICRDLHESQTSLRQQQMNWSWVFISISFCFLGAGCPLGKQCAIKEAFNAVGR